MAKYLSHHEVVRAAEMGWAELRNGELLAAAETAGFDVLVTMDREHGLPAKSLWSQAGIRDLAVWTMAEGEAVIKQVVEAIDGARPGSYTDLKV